MKNKLLPVLFLFLLSCKALTDSKDVSHQTKPEETIFVFGGDINPKFVQYVADLTNKQKPKICYLPTASADNEKNIKYWENICQIIGIEPIILKVWVSSSPTNKEFEEILLNIDAIIVGGGNTLNMLGIWKTQGIDKILEKALKKGIILSGGSAGSICWFRNGISDSRPVKLSSIEGLGFLPYSNCPHYSNEARKELFHQMILNKEIPYGYACDDRAGILFKNGQAVDFISQSDNHNAYLIMSNKGKLVIEKMDSKILLKKNSLSENDFTTTPVDINIKEYLDKVNNKITPLDAYVTTIKNLQLSKINLGEHDKSKILNIKVYETYLYNNTLAGVVNDAYQGFYGLWYFYNHNGNWESAGEDIGGETLFECAITFREKAKTIIETTEKQLNSH